MLNPLLPDNLDWQPRLACDEDIPAMETLIPLSVRALQANCYSVAQMDAAIGTIFGVDRQLIRDGTYFIVEREAQILGCGGWSKRRSLYGSDALRTGPDPELDPKRDKARIRAFFVHPMWARRGIGRNIMMACEKAIVAAGFRGVEISATITGKLLYASFGYKTVEHYELHMAGNLRLPVVRMTKTFQS
ncbi:MAG TPA: GNAT family N-acetyltransferase [Verrucomicrobiae bacterium]|jgi:GNAT superfamily N-acetyltransferase|nr:GNAT family N-acetyltransferase [Verrucomicrobiae bacterium]